MNFRSNNINQERHSIPIDKQLHPSSGSAIIAMFPYTGHAGSWLVIVLKLSFFAITDAELNCEDVATNADCSHGELIIKRYKTYYKTFNSFNSQNKTNEIYNFLERSKYLIHMRIYLSFFLLQLINSHLQQTSYLSKSCSTRRFRTKVPQS